MKKLVLRVNENFSNHSYMADPILESVKKTPLYDQLKKVQFDIAKSGYTTPVHLFTALLNNMDYQQLDEDFTALEMGGECSNTLNLIKDIINGVYIPYEPYELVMDIVKDYYGERALRLLYDLGVVLDSVNNETFILTELYDAGAIDAVSDTYLISYKTVHCEHYDDFAIVKNC